MEPAYQHPQPIEVESDPHMIWRDGDRMIIDQLAAANTEFGNSKTGSRKSIMMIATFDHEETRNRFSNKLRLWLSGERHIGIVIPASIAVKHSKIFNERIEAAFVESKCNTPYSIAYRTFDFITGAQSITEVTMTSPRRFVYKSSVQGPVDCFSFELFNNLSSVRVIQINPPTNPTAFYTDFTYFRDAIRAFNQRLLCRSTATADLHQLWVSPRVLLAKGREDSQPSLLDVFAVWAGNVCIEKLMLTGNFDEEAFETNSDLRSSIYQAFPYLESLEYYSSANI